MFRLWGRIWQSNHMKQDYVYEDATADTRTHKICAGIDEFCRQFDLSKPIWLDSNISEFQRHSKTRFSQDNFIDAIDFDYLEIQVLEED